VLADAPEGVTEALMLAHGFRIALLVDLCIAGLATASVERMVCRLPSKIAAAVTADMSERGRLERLVLAWGHVANKSGAPSAAFGTAGRGSIKVASWSLARELTATTE
jgi:hypothetical protein